MTCSTSVIRSPLSSSAIKPSLPAKSTRESLLYKFSPVIKLLQYMCIIMILTTTKEIHTNELDNGTYYQDDYLCTTTINILVQQNERKTLIQYIQMRNIEFRNIISSALKSRFQDFRKLQRVINFFRHKFYRRLQRLQANFS